jgi:hypothetical protein
VKILVEPSGRQVFCLLAECFFPFSLNRLFGYIFKGFSMAEDYLTFALWLAVIGAAAFLAAWTPRFSP